MAKLKKTESTEPARWLDRRKDMAEVLEIEKRSFAAPWWEEDFLIHLRDPKSVGIVYRTADDRPLHAFLVYWVNKRVLHINRLAVAPEVRRTGLGKYLVTRLIEKLPQQNRHLITVEVDEHSVGAQLFFSRLGFKALGCGDGVIQFAYMRRDLLDDKQYSEGFPDDNG